MATAKQQPLGKQYNLHKKNASLSVDLILPAG